MISFARLSPSLVLKSDALAHEDFVVHHRHFMLRMPVHTRLPAVGWCSRMAIPNARDIFG